MSPQQFERWSDFASRMAMHGWPDATDARKLKIADAVECFVSSMEDYAADINDWDSGNKRVYVCDEMTVFLDEYCHTREDGEQTRFEAQVCCCVRAGLDVAVAPSAGVVGFTVGMLRRMWDGSPPNWVTEWFDPPLPADALDTDSVWI